MEKYSHIRDKYTDINQVTQALRKAGLESSNLIIGIDFTKSNEWTGKYSFDGLSLHALLPNGMNPYEQAISIIGRTLYEFDEDSLIPCFGFGDATTHDQSCFNFNPDGSPCEGFEGVLKRYREILPYVILSGPTSYAPIIHAAIDVVRKSGNQFHILVIIADGQVTGNVRGGMLSVQEKVTIDAIVAASNYPLSIILVGVGDGPWDKMKWFDDAIPQRKFDNFQFVNFTEVMSKCSSPTHKEAEFAVAALMEIPKQYKAIQRMQGLSQPQPTPLSSSNVHQQQTYFSSWGQQPQLVPQPFKQETIATMPSSYWKPQPQHFFNATRYNYNPMNYNGHY